MLKVLEALEGDLKFVGILEGGWVVENRNIEQRNYRHCEDLMLDCSVALYSWGLDVMQ